MKRSDVEIPDNPRTQRIIKQLRAENPTATSDLEALIFDYRKSQAQDRRDIADLLDQERKLRQDQADLHDELMDKERRFKELDAWAKQQDMTPADTKDTADAIAAGKKPSLPLSKKERPAERPATKSKTIRKKKDSDPETPAPASPAAKADTKKPIKRRKTRRPEPKAKAEKPDEKTAGKSPALDKVAQQLTTEPDQPDLFAEPVPQPTQQELPLRGGSNVLPMRKSTTTPTTQAQPGQLLNFPTRSEAPPWDPRLTGRTGTTGTNESLFRAMYTLLQEGEVVSFPGANRPATSTPNQELAVQKANNLITLIVRGDPANLIPDIRNDIQRLGYRFTKKPNGTMILVHTESNTQVPVPMHRLPQDVQRAVSKITLVKESNGAGKVRRLHYFNVDSPRTAQEYGLRQDKLGNWMMIEFERSGEPFRQKLQAAIRIFGQPRSITL